MLSVLLRNDTETTEDGQSYTVLGPPYCSEAETVSLLRWMFENILSRSLYVKIRVRYGKSVKTLFVMELLVIRDYIALEIEWSVAKAQRKK